MASRSPIVKFAIIGLIILLLGTLFVYGCLREHKQWTESVKFLDGTEGKADFHYSAWQYLSLGHAGGYGGGDDHYRLQMHTGGKLYTWSGGDERPFVFGLRDGKLYMAVFDRGTYNRECFRYYRSDEANVLKEIPPDEFPKALAIQNTWLDKEGIELLTSMDPEDWRFRESLTAKMWLHLEKGVDYWKTQEAPPEVITEFKAKYLKDVPTSSTPAKGS